MTLVEFLLARIAEDEAQVCDGAQGTRTSAYGWHTVDCGTGLGYWALDECTCRYVDRVLAECEAKRRIVEHYEGDQRVDSGTYACKFLAAVYADHPDYDESWRA